MGLRRVKVDEAAEVERRLDAWTKASVRVQKVVDQHELKGYASLNPTVPYLMYNSAAEQHVDLIIRVADWLLEDKEQ